jgi:quinol monooxygenase YgiN
VQSDHFRHAQAELPQYLEETPRVVNFQVGGTEWSELGEMRVER